MVSCQEPSPLKGRKNSLQRHPHAAALVNAHFFVSMGVEARCRPCHSAAHCRHMKRQPSHPHCCHCHGRCHFNCHHYRHCCCRRRHCCCHHCRCHHRYPLPLLLPSPLATAIAVAVTHCCRHLCCVAISHRRCHHRHTRRWPLPSLSPSAIAVAISVGHHRLRCHRQLQRVVALAW
jgi:hypothetical protein